jgi:N-acetylglucosamine malate deacetylase 1
MSNILVISPHPDDEAIGCGGTIRWHILNGDNVEVIFLTSGEKGGHGLTEEETIKVREKEAYAAADILEISKIDFWKEPDGAFEATIENVGRLIEKVEKFQPTTIYVPHQNEEHPDHKAAADLVRKAINQISGSSERPVVWMYEVWTPIQKINHIVDISGYVDIKRKAILAHKCQCDVMSFDEAILGLNRYRGEMFSWPEGEYAEVFTGMKE